MIINRLSTRINICINVTSTSAYRALGTHQKCLPLGWTATNVTPHVDSRGRNMDSDKILILRPLSYLNTLITIEIICYNGSTGLGRATEKLTLNLTGAERNCCASDKRQHLQMADACCLRCFFLLRGLVGVCAASTVPTVIPPSSERKKKKKLTHW